MYCFIEHAATLIGELARVVVEVGPVRMRGVDDVVNSERYRWLGVMPILQ